jgi:hypothetical protein
MVSGWYKALPFIAIVGLFIALFVALIVGPWTGRQALLAETGETRRAVEGQVLQSLLAMHPPSVDDGAFRQAVARAKKARYVAVVWLFAPDGQIVEGTDVAMGHTAEEWATEEMRRVLRVLPEGSLDDGQRVQLLAASAMGREGEHNDVFRHLLRQVRGPDGTVVALLGLTYDVSPSISAPGLGYKATVLALLLGLLVYWLSLPAWTWLDAQARGERAWIWAVFVLLGNLVALTAYLLVRGPRAGRSPTG